MAIKRLDREDEARLLGYTEQLVDLVNQQQLSPDQALTKLATDNEILPGHLRLIAKAYNNGAVNFRRKTAADLLTKAAIFPLADADKVIQELYPKQVKTAAQHKQQYSISTDYDKPPVFKELNAYPLTVEKKASAPPDRREYVANQVLNCKQLLQRELAEKRSQVTAAYDKLSNEFDKLRLYLRRQPEQLVFLTKQAVTLYGHMVKVIAKHLYEEDSYLAKQAQVISNNNQTFNPNLPWCQHLTTIIKLANDHATLQRDYSNLQQQAHTLLPQLFRTVLPGDTAYTSVPYGSILKPWTKQSDLAGRLSDIALDTVKAPLETLIPSKPTSLTQKSLLDLYDPDHEAELGKLKAQATLHGLLTQDDFLAGENPEKVTKMYNDIVNIAPRVGDKPMILRALLRKYLSQGQVDTFDLAQLTDMDNKLKQTLEEPLDKVNYPTVPREEQ